MESLLIPLSHGLWKLLRSECGFSYLPSVISRGGRGVISAARAGVGVGGPAEAALGSGSPGFAVGCFQGNGNRILGSLPVTR